MLEKNCVVYNPITSWNLGIPGIYPLAFNRNSSQWSSPPRPCEAKRFVAGGIAVGTSALRMVRCVTHGNKICCVYTAFADGIYRWHSVAFIFSLLDVSGIEPWNPGDINQWMMETCCFFFQQSQGFKGNMDKMYSRQFDVWVCLKSVGQNDELIFIMGMESGSLIFRHTSFVGVFCWFNFCESQD